MKINPLTIKKINRFKSIRRGYYSFIFFSIMILLSIFAEVMVNKRALVVKYEGNIYFPIYSSMIPGKTFGFDYEYETNYRDLKKKMQEQKNGNWLLMPIVPYDPFENDLREGEYPPYPPDINAQHYLGTDTIGRDLTARLVYGFRICIFFSLILLLLTYLIGVAIGCIMGYYGGKFDLIFQRVIEIWTNVPFLYVIIIISSIIVPSFWILILIMTFFGWISMTWTMRTITYKEKEREYTLAAKAMGAGDMRIIFRHILPNTVSVIVSYIPFAISSGIMVLTSLDYLGFGLPPPTPSWGELLNQGWENMHAWWIVASVIVAMLVTLTCVTFIGEAIREAFDPKRHTIYE